MRSFAWSGRRNMRMKSKKRRSRQCAYILIAALLGVFIWWNNCALSISRIEIAADVEDGIRILHLSDLHGAWFGKEQSRVMKYAEEIQPDVIALTGDFVDRRCDEEAAVRLIERLAAIAPVYCVTGNHEELERRAGTGTYERLLAAVETMENAFFLRGETAQLTGEITLTGADDIPFAGGMDAYPEYLNGLGEIAEGEFRILLAHRPEMFQHYAEAGFDLTLSGHAHGGQFRFPLIGGLLAPGQGWLPEYDSGLFADENGRMMYVSRGLGNSVFPLRLFNRPEMTVIEIG